jgi:DNA-binding CsgD family transcriptional regulator
MPDRLQRGRDAFARQAWTVTREAFSDASWTELGAADLERLATASYMIGNDDESAAAWEAAQREHAKAGNAAEAARCTFWLALGFLLRGQMAQASGWLTRAEAIIEAAGSECAAVGYLLIPALLGALEEGDATGARTMAVRATEIGDRFHDPDLGAFGTLAHGQALIAMGDTTAGIARLDDVMVSVTRGDVGPVTSGIVYCAVVLECMRLFDFARASEWTNALSVWCDAQPDLVPYRGQCLVHRSQLQQASGDWRDAILTIESARRRLTDPPHPALGMAHYQAAELHRLTGAFDEAEAEYQQANRHGYAPMPGLALLELAAGDSSAAAASIRRALREVGSSLERPALLGAAVDILRAAGDLDGIRGAADELADIAAGSSSAVIHAMAAQAVGTALLGEGAAPDALTHLRAAAAVWHRLNMPYECARTALLIGLSCAALGDSVSAALEFRSASDTFMELGALPDLDRLKSLTAGLVATVGSQDAVDLAPRLSAREREVLGHVAAGKTNKEIATDLLISEHTVGRHLENIFTKLDVTSRAGATAWAYEHHIL